MARRTLIRVTGSALLLDDEVEGFPGVATVQPVKGIGAPVVLVVLEKPR